MPIPELSKQMVGRLRNDWRREAAEVLEARRAPNADVVARVIAAAAAEMRSQKIDYCDIDDETKRIARYLSEHPGCCHHYRSIE